MSIAVQSFGIQSYQSQLNRAQATDEMFTDASLPESDADLVNISGLHQFYENIAEKFDVQRMIRRDRTALASELYSLGLINHQAHQMLANVASAEEGEVDLTATMDKAVSLLPFSQRHVAKQLRVVSENLHAARALN